METVKIAIIIGSTRPNRFSEKPAQWIFEQAQKIEDVETELLDLREYALPFFDMPTSPARVLDGDYGNDMVNAFAKKIAAADAYVIVSPEYNHGPSAIVKNALDSIYTEWINKPVGFVSYGGVGGARAVEQLRQVCIELQMAPIRNAVHIPSSVLFPIIMGKAEWKPNEDDSLTDSADKMLAQLLWWTHALKAARSQIK